jgi:DUF1680 family protein
VLVSINGKPVAYTLENGYAVLSRQWKKGDVVQVKLPMEVRRVIANANVRDDLGKVALQRGPLIYCAEWPDNSAKVSNIILPNDAKFQTEFMPSLLNGVTVVKSEVPAILVENNRTVSTATMPFVAIPYYAWAHRGKGEMKIWFPITVKNIEIIPAR